jgi:hypothetical protein
MTPMIMTMTTLTRNKLGGDRALVVRYARDCNRPDDEQSSDVGDRSWDADIAGISRRLVYVFLSHGQL